MNTQAAVQEMQKLYKTVASPRTASRAKRWLGVVLRMLFIVGFCFLILYPVILMLSRAFMSKADIFDNEVILLPKSFTLDTVKLAAKMLHYGESLLNSLIISSSSALLQTASCILAGYGFARFNFRFKGLLFAMVIFTMIVPPQLVIIPVFMQFYDFNPLGLVHLFGQNLSLIDSYTPFLLLSATASALKNGLFIFLFRQFFKNMPKETEESALVDGAGTFRTFASIMVPNAVTIIATVFLFAFVWQYNDIVFSSTFLPNMRTLPLGYVLLNTIPQEDVIRNGLDPLLSSPQYMAAIKSTGVLLILAPILILYIFTQRYFVEGIERSGLVG